MVGHGHAKAVDEIIERKRHHRLLEAGLETLLAAVDGFPERRQRRADLGHLSGFPPLALKLRERGHTVTFILRDLANVQSLLGERGFLALQAPVWLSKAGGLPRPLGANPAPNIFSVISNRRPAISTALEALRELDAESLVFAPGLGILRAQARH
jgi:hypothetical protein